MPPKPLLSTANLARLSDELGDDSPLETASTALTRWFDSAIESLIVASTEGELAKEQEQAERRLAVHLLEALRNSFFALSTVHVDRLTSSHPWASAPSTKPPLSRIAGWFTTRGEDVDPRWSDSLTQLIELRVEISSLVRAVAAALAAADRCLEDFASRPREPLRWSEDEDLVRLLQDLLASESAGDGASALDRIASLRRELIARHHVRAFEYDPSRAHLFHVETGDAGLMESQTLAPALVHEDIVIKRGLARVPQEQIAAMTGPNGGNSGLGPKGGNGGTAPSDGGPSDTNRNPTTREE